MTREETKQRQQRALEQQRHDARTLVKLKALAGANSGATAAERSAAKRKIDLIEDRIKHRGAPPLPKASELPALALAVKAKRRAKRAAAKARRNAPKPELAPTVAGPREAPR
jgi:hypothetical protein